MTARDLESMFAGAADDPAEETPAPKAVQVSMEMLRGMLTAKINGGYKAEVKALLERYGIRKLSELEPALFEDAYLSAQAIGTEVESHAG